MEYSILLSVSVISLLFITLTVSVRSFTTIPYSGALSTAFAFLVGLLSIGFNGLSLFEALTRSNVLWFVSLTICVLLLFTLRAGVGYNVNEARMLFLLIRKCFISRLALTMLPLLLLIGLTAWLYPPNNYDSLTYHMARVAHWLQNQSIAYYPTPVERQNVMGPGAEYLILLAQIITSSDHLANFVQFAAFVLLVPSGFYLGRLLGLPRKLLPAVVILSATAPIAIFQASTTKNDIVAALMVYATLIACRRLLVGDVRKCTLNDIIFFGLCLGASYLVKPTALLVASPIVAFGAFLSVIQYRLSFRQVAHLAAKWSLAVISFAVVAGPDIFRKMIEGGSRHEVYSLVNGYDYQRLLNVYAVFIHNLPFKEEVEQLYVWLGGKGLLYTTNYYTLQEDLIGNPTQGLLFVVLTVGGIFMVPFFRKSSNSIRYLLFFAPVLSWIAFGLVVKNQLWITRLQIPLFYLLPFSFLSIDLLLKKIPLFKRGIFLLFHGAALFSLAYAMYIASNVPARKLIPHYFWGESPDRIKAYYNNFPKKSEHDFFLQSVRESQCRNIGLILGPDSAEYPLTWRALHGKMQVTHLRDLVVRGGGRKRVTMDKAVDEVCAIYVADGVREYVPEQGKRWISAGDYHTFLRDYSYEFNQSSTPCLLVNSTHLDGIINDYHNMDIEYLEDGISIISQGVDPRWVFVDEEGRCDRLHRAVLRVDMESSVKTMLQVYYTAPGQQGFIEKSSIKVQVAPGENIMYLPLTNNMLSGDFRLDIGQKPGAYLLRSFEIRSY